MLNKTIQEALNEQINAELYSAYLYLSMAAYFESLNLKGFSNWMRVQTQEEMVHGMKMYNFIVGKGGRVSLQAIDQPTLHWESPLAAFEAAYNHERIITKRIDALVALADKEKDYATGIMLQWFVTEQIEEESSTDEIVQKLKLMADFPGGLFLLNQELGTRVFVLPVDMGGTMG